MTLRKSNVIELVRQVTPVVPKAEDAYIVLSPRDPESAGFQQALVHRCGDGASDLLRFEVSEFSPYAGATLPALFVRETKGIDPGYAAFAEKETNTLVAQLVVPCGPLEEIPRRRLVKIIAEIGAKGRQVRARLVPNSEALAKRYSATSSYVKQVVPYTLASKVMSGFGREVAGALYSRAAVALVEREPVRRRLALEVIAAEMTKLNDTLSQFDLPAVPAPKAAELLIGESPGIAVFEATQISSTTRGGPPPSVWLDFLRDSTDRRGLLLTGSAEELQEIFTVRSAVPDPLLPMVATPPAPDRRELIRYFAAKALGAAPDEQDVEDMLSVLGDFDESDFDRAGRVFVRAWAANAERLGRWTRRRLRALADSLLARRRTLKDVWPNDVIELQQEEGETQP